MRHDDDRRVRAGPVGRDRVVPAAARRPGRRLRGARAAAAHRAHRARRRRSPSGVAGAASSSSCSPTRSRRPTSSASPSGASLFAVAAIVALRRHQRRRLAGRPRRRARQRRARLRAGLARRHLRLPLHPHRDRRLGVHALDRRLPASRGRTCGTRGPPRPGSSAPWATPGTGQLRALAGRASLVLVPAALLLGARRCARSSWATTPRARSARASSRTGSALIGFAIVLVGVRHRRRRADPVRGADGRPDRRAGCSAPRRAASLAAGLVGAIIVLAAELVAVHAAAGRRCRPASSPAPIGAPYLIWLLATANRAGRGG